MWIGAVEFDVLLGDVHSLKAKRSVIRPLVAELRRRFEATVGEVGHVDLHRRALVGAAVVAAQPGRAIEVLDRIERSVAERPEIELLSARRTLVNTEDDD